MTDRPSTPVAGVIAAAGRLAKSANNSRHVV